MRIVFLAGGIRFVTADPLKGTPLEEDDAYRSARADLITRVGLSGTTLADDPAPVQFGAPPPRRRTSLEFAARASGGGRPARRGESNDIVH